MPLPLGHTALGLTAYEIGAGKDTGFHHIRLFLLITFLANLPDFDMVAGLLVNGNGNLFHRGPTHSLLFALVAGFLASRAWKVIPQIPRISFVAAFLVVCSHVLGDLFFTDAPVSLFWPLELNWSNGYSNLQDIFHSVLFQGLRDMGIIVASIPLVALIRLGKRTAKRWGVWQPLRPSE